MCIIVIVTDKEVKGMKGIVCYYSATGNTKLAIQHIIKKLSIPFDLCNIARDPVPNFAQYDIAGFACPVDWLAEPYLMRKFLSELPTVNGTPAFVFTTFGGLPGRTLPNLKKAASLKGFKVIAAHGLHTPDNYPPVLYSGRHKNYGMPDDREMEALTDFINELETAIEDIGKGRPVKEAKVKTNLLGAIAGNMSRERSKKAQGPKFVDEKLCTKCGKCEKGCPYKAIKLDPYPKFDESLCYGCWACFNRCPEKAIYTKKYRGKGQYPGPTEELKKKLPV
jgi:ferredoxin